MTKKHAKWAKWGVALAIAVAGLLLFQHPLERLIGPRNIASGKGVTASLREGNTPELNVLTNDTLEDRLGACATAEAAPWLEIDLGEPTALKSAHIYNRDDGWMDQQLPLVVKVSSDGESYTTTARRTRMFTQEWPWRLDLEGVTARYIRFIGESSRSLCLSEVELFGR